MTPGLPGGAPGFDRLFDMLETGHGRIACQRDTPDRLLARLPAHGADVQARQAARRTLRYAEPA